MSDVGHFCPQCLLSDKFRVATVMGQSWNFEIFWNFWKSHGIWTKIEEGHGKVMEFLNWSKKSWKYTNPAHRQGSHLTRVKPI